MFAKLFPNHVNIFLLLTLIDAAAMKARVSVLRSPHWTCVLTLTLYSEAISTFQ